MDKKELITIGSKGSKQYRGVLNYGTMCDLQKNTTKIWLVKLLREGIFFPWYHMYIWCAKKLFHKVKCWIAVAYRVFITFLRFKSPILSLYSLTLDFISLIFWKFSRKF